MDPGFSALIWDFGIVKRIWVSQLQSGILGLSIESRFLSSNLGFRDYQSNPGQLANLSQCLVPGKTAIKVPVL